MYPDSASSSTYVNDSVSLNVIHVRVAQAQLSSSSLSGTDNSSGNCVLEGKRAANSHHKLPGP